MVDVPPEVFDPVDIAMMEYAKNAIPITVWRES